jgi:drug/metabolite transporter (DMT)-like permease
MDRVYNRTLYFPALTTAMTAPRHPRPRHWAMLAFLCAFWGLAFFLIAVGLESFQPLTVVNIRLFVGAAVLYALMRWQGHRLPVAPAWWRRFALLSLVGNLVPFILIAWGETRISSSQAGLLMALMPISTMVMAHFFISHEPLTPRRMAGVLLGFAGVLVLIGGDSLTGIGGAQLIAQLAVVAASLSYAANSVYTKRIPPINTLVVATGSLIAGTLMLLPWTLIIEQPWHLSPAANSVLATVLLGVFSTGLATWVFFKVVADCGPGFLSIINYIIPAVAFAAGVLLLGEPAQPSQFLGLIAICGGITMTQSRNPVRADAGSAAK